MPQHYSMDIMSRCRFDALRGGKFARSAQSHVSCTLSTTSILVIHTLRCIIDSYEYTRIVSCYIRNKTDRYVVIF